MPDDPDPLLPDLGGGALPDMPLMPDMGSLLGMAMEMQQQLLAAQEEASQAVVEGQSGGGAVRIEVTGGLEFRSVTIDPSAVDPDDVEMLQDLVLAALHDAVGRASELAQASNPMAGFDLGSLDLGGLGGLGGGGGLGGLGGIGGLGDLGSMLGLGDEDELGDDEDEVDADETDGAATDAAGPAAGS